MCYNLINQQLLILICTLLRSTTNDAIFPPEEDIYLGWNIRIEIVNDRRDLFSELFNDFTNLEIEILASFNTWSESPQYVDSLNSILFSSPTDRNLYRYNLETEITTLFIEDAGEWAGVYDRDIPLNELLEAGPNGITIGLNGIEDYVILNQLALGRIIAFDPLNVDENDIIIIADSFDGEELNSPNDVTITSEGGALYFTDPTFGLQREGDTGFLDCFGRSKLGFKGVYKVHENDVLYDRERPELVVDEMPAPNGLAVTNNGKYLIVSNTGTELGWSPYWNIYRTKKGHDGRYGLHKRINFNMTRYPWNGFMIGGPLADGMEVVNDDILLTTGPNGVYLMDLKRWKLVGRIAIDHLISNIGINDNWLYITGENHLWRIKLTGL